MIVPTLRKYLPSRMLTTAARIPSQMKTILKV